MASVSLILNVKVLIFPAIFTGGSTSALGGGFEDPLKHRHPSNPSSTASATTEGLGSGAKKDQQNSYLKELEAQIRSAFSTIACLRIIGIFHIKQKFCGYREQRARREQEKRDQKADWWEKKTDPAYTLPSPTKPHPSQVRFHSFMNYHVPSKNDEHLSYSLPNKI